MSNKRKLETYNASFLAQKIAFRDEIEGKEFNGLMDGLSRTHRPVGMTEQMLIAQMALSLWSQRDLYAWEWAEIRNRQGCTSAIVKGLRDDGNAQQLALVSAAEQSWAAQEFVVRAGMGSENQDALLNEGTNTRGHVLIEAKLTSPLDLILRYKAALKRDFHNALQDLIVLQRERQELDQPTPAIGGKRS